MRLYPQNHQFLASQKENRLIFQHQSPIEDFSQKEEPNLKNVTDNLTDTVKESYSKRLGLMKDLENQLSNISSEQKQHQELLAQMQLDLSKNNDQPLHREFTCLGQTIEIIMNPNGEYQEYLNGKDLNFLQWAIQTKQSKSSDNLHA